MQNNFKFCQRCKISWGWSKWLWRIIWITRKAPGKGEASRVQAVNKRKNHVADEMTGTSKGKDLNLRGLRQAIGKIDDAFRYFFAKMSSFWLCCESQTWNQGCWIVLSDNLVKRIMPPPNQHLIYSLFIWRIKKEVCSRYAFDIWKLKQTAS